jgi:hypothetical protein
MNNGIVNIRGKEYKTVALRVQEFRDKFPNYFLTTEIVKIDDEQCIIKAYAGIHIDGGVQTFATGHAQEFRKSSQINGTSYVENCETSAIGRCLSALGLLSGGEFASANEVVNAIHQQNNPVKEEVSEPELTVAKNKLLEASKVGKLKETFFGLKPAVQELLREYANELKKSA